VTADRVPAAAEPPPDDDSLTAPRQLATYEDLGYRDRFWPARAYEDACDRTALRAFLPLTGGRLLDVGAGFGRLADEYGGWPHVGLLDSSEVHVAAARDRFRGDPRFEIRLGDALSLPWPDATFDAAVCVRVLHHFEDPGPIIAELGRVVRPGGALVLEFANKRNLKSMARRLLGMQTWSPFEPGSVAYRPYHVDHSPVSVRRALRRAGFAVERTRAVSLFRVQLLCRTVPAGVLARLERPLQEPLGSITPGPSVFVLARRRA
jgi:ubiquinone/menaquinone biosynthesis C-methylase UbiE